MKDLARPRRPWDRTPVADREYFDILGPGLVAVLPGRRPDDSAAGGWRPPTGGAWLHIDPQGNVLAFTGKAEVGQGTRAALTTVVSNELGVPADRVSVIMGDTDLCPWDMGTFGSRSMPDAAPALGVVAEGALAALLGIAAERSGKAASDLSVVDGEIRIRGESRTFGFGDLVRGGQRVVTVAPRDSWVPSRVTSRGRRASTAVGVDAVTGRRIFGSDLRRPGLRFGALLHPPSYGARLVSVDASAAQALPDVTIVRDGDFVGVVALTHRQARAAVASIRTEWDPSDQPDEGTIEAYLRSHPMEGDFWDQEEEAAGDAESAFRRASVSITKTYRTAYIAHVPLETRSAMAEWDGPRLTIWVGTQTPFRARDAIAEALGLKPEAVRVIVPSTGAGFGGKHGGELGVAAARLSRAVHAPVRLSYTREEEFRFAYFRPMSVIDVGAAADASGRLLAWTFHNINGGSAALSAPYRVADRKIDNELSRSPLPQGSYRALAATANNFARETAIDEIATAVGVNPLPFRRTNLEDERLRAVLERAVALAGWERWKPSSGRGHGLAVGLEKDSRVATIAEVSVTDERRVRVDRLVTAFEAGAIVNPENLRSQVEGATTMGLGGALFEAVRFERGTMTNAHLAEYRVPRFSDLPELLVELIDRPDLPPSGAGETPMIAVAPAIGNAIFDATGVRIRTLPLVPDGRIPDAGSR